MANSISVAVGESDTIRRGRSSIETGPLVAATVTGKAEVAVRDGSEDASGLEALAHADPARNTARRIGPRALGRLPADETPVPRLRAVRLEQPEAVRLAVSAAKTRRRVEAMLSTSPAERAAAQADPGVAFPSCRDSRPTPARRQQAFGGPTPPLGNASSNELTAVFGQ